MICNLESTGELTRKMTVKIPNSYVDGEVVNKLKEIRRSFSLPGFRPGHVPQNIVEKKFSSSVRDEVVHNALEKAIHEKITSDELDVAGNLDIQEPQTSEEGDVCFEATFEVFPDFELKPFADFEIEKPKVLIDDASVERALENFLRTHGTFTAADKKAEENDFVKITVEVTLDGVRNKHLDWKDGIAKIGEKSTRFTGVFEALKGLSAGDKVTVNDDAEAGSFVYDVTVLEVGQLELAEINDEFIQEMNFEGSTAADVKEEIKKQLLDRAEHYAAEELTGKVIDTLVAAYDFTIPSVILKKDTDDCAHDCNDDTHQHGKDPNLDSVKESILVRVLSKKLGISLNKEVMTSYYNKLAAQTGMQPSFFAMMADYSAEYKNEHQYKAIVDQIVDRFLKEATCKDKEVPLSDYVSIV